MRLPQVFLCLTLFISLQSWGQYDVPSPLEQQSAKILAEGTRLLKAGKPYGAIEYFDKLIASYEERFKDDKTKIFCSRSQAEALF